MELWDKKVLLWLNHMYPNLSISIIAIHWIVYWIHLRQHVYLAALLARVVSFFSARRDGGKWQLHTRVRSMWPGRRRWGCLCLRGCPQKLSGGPDLVIIIDATWCNKEVDTRTLAAMEVAAAEVQKAAAALSMWHGDGICQVAQPGEVMTGTLEVLVMLYVSASPFYIEDLYIYIYLYCWASCCFKSRNITEYFSPS